MFLENINVSSIKPTIYPLYDINKCVLSKKGLNNTYLLNKINPKHKNKLLRII